MSRPPKPTYDLTDAEKRDLTQLIAQGRPLPEKYRFILFEDKREVENKDGAVKRERLTNHWTDWVDYWAVDFDYMSRKEIIKVPRGMGVEGSLPGVPPRRATWSNTKIAGAVVTSSRTNGRAFARARTGSWS